MIKDHIEFKKAEEEYIRKLEDFNRRFLELGREKKELNLLRTSIF